LFRPRAAEPRSRASNSDFSHPRRVQHTCQGRQLKRMLGVG
jgi:hypothetical protein